MDQLIMRATLDAAHDIVCVWGWRFLHANVLICRYRAGHIKIFRAA